MAKKAASWWAVLYPWIIWTIAASFFFYKYLIQVSPSVMTADLMSAFGVHGAGLGNLSAFYFYAYLIMQIPVGVILDRYSPRWITGVAILLCAVSTALFAHAETLWFASVCRAMMGAGAAFAAVSCFKLASQWFRPNRFALVSGMFMTAAMLGAVGGQMPLSLLVQGVGWRDAMSLLGIAGIGLSILYVTIIRDKTTDKTTQPVRQSIQDSLSRMLFNKQTWTLSLYSGLAFAPVSVFGGLWGVPFLEVAHGLSKADAAFSVSMIFIGFAIGAPTLGWLSDYMGRRKPILFLSTFLSLITLSLVLYTSMLPGSLLTACLFLFGLGTSGFFTSFAMIREVFPLALAATALGIMNTFDSVCEALYEPLVGVFLDATWQGNIIDGVHIFETHGYRIALSLLPISLILSIVTLCFIRETFCRTHEG